MTHKCGSIGLLANVKVTYQPANFAEVLKARPPFHNNTNSYNLKYMKNHKQERYEDRPMRPIGKLNLLRQLNLLRLYLVRQSRWLPILLLI